MNQYGRDVSQSDENAAKFYCYAAQRGNWNAQYNLGEMFEKGKGVQQCSKQAVKWYRNAAEQGHAGAQNSLGRMYGNGNGVAQSYDMAVKWYSKAAEQGQADAQFNVGMMYAVGQGVLRSDVEAVHWHRKAAEQGHATGQYELGNAYEKGKGIPQSFTNAAKWYHAAAEQGNAHAQYRLGQMYEYGKGVGQSYDKALNYYRKAANLGQTYAQFNLGIMYSYGKGVSQSDEEAVKWYRKAAEQGNADAQNNLGWMNTKGRGVCQCNEEAVNWYLKAAEQGSSDGQYNLGCMYKNGLGVPQSYEEAAKWYQKAAEQGNAKAQNNLGRMYAKGKGFSQSDEEAIRWYNKAAEQGNACAQYNLGLLYECGQGVLQSQEKAVKWYQKAANQQNAYAQYKLGVAHEMGHGVPQSNEKAIEWYRKAAEQGNADAQSSLGEMYNNGKGVQQSYESAIEFYRKAAKHNHANAQYNLGAMFEKGRGVQQCNEEAIKWYRNAAEQGHAGAQNSLGRMYGNGNGVAQSYDVAVKWYRKAAEQGHVGAQFNLGWMFENDSGILQSYQEAALWYHRAAKQGHAEAQYNLGLMYQYGKGVPQSDEIAAIIYRYAAEQGNSNAASNLSLMYANECGVSQSGGETVRWYRTAAEQSNAADQNNLDVMYENGNLGVMYGKGVEVSEPVEGVLKWHLERTEQCSANAQTNLATRCGHSHDVWQSTEAAGKLFPKAMKLEHTLTKFNQCVLLHNTEAKQNFIETNYNSEEVEKSDAETKTSWKGNRHCLSGIHEQCSALSGDAIPSLGLSTASEILADKQPFYLTATGESLVFVGIKDNCLNNAVFKETIITAISHEPNESHTIYEKLLLDKKTIAVKGIKTQGQAGTLRELLRHLALKDHKHVVKFLPPFISYLTEDLSAVIMEHYSLGNLETLLFPESNNCRFSYSIGVALGWCMQLCSAVAFLENISQTFSIDQTEIVFDLKPANILLSENHHEIRLCDFEDAFINLASGKTPVGTLNYTAPEILIEQKYSSKSNVYSIGIVIHQIIIREKLRRRLHPVTLLQDNSPRALKLLYLMCCLDLPESRPSVKVLENIVSQILNSCSVGLRNSPVNHDAKSSPWGWDEVSNDWPDSKVTQIWIEKGCLLPLSSSDAQEIEKMVACGRCKALCGSENLFKITYINQDFIFKKLKSMNLEICQEFLQFIANNSHINILQLFYVGHGNIHKSILIEIKEFSKLGSLHEVLFCDSSMCPANLNYSVGVALKWCYQITCGINFIHNLIPQRRSSNQPELRHGHLTLPNILMFSEYQLIKLSDIDPNQHISKNKSSSTKRIDRNGSLASDVNAFGKIVYQIMNRSQFPEPLTQHIMSHESQFVFKYIILHCCLADKEPTMGILTNIFAQMLQWCPREISDSPLSKTYERKLPWGIQELRQSYKADKLDCLLKQCNSFL